MRSGKAALFIAGIVLAGLMLPLPAHASIKIEILYVERQTPRPATLSNLNAPPEDLGAAGARIAIEDNATTGKFLGHDYSLREVIVAPETEFMPEVKKALAERPAQYVVVNAPADDLLAVADLPELKDALVFNAGAADTRLRNEDCRANLLHTASSRAMLADALMQFLVKKRWSKLFLVTGPNPADRLYGQAIRDSAAKFRLKIVADKPWPFAADIRRTAQSEIPVFTQDVDYDILIVADETGDFGEYLLYQTWLPRPVAGTHGLTPAAWSPVIEQWGAAQLQSRFKKRTKRSMLPDDFNVWAAVRVVGEAVTKVNSADFAAVAAYIRSPEARFAQYKKYGLNFRSWNGQLRQPVPLVHAGALVALPPLEGFLHSGSELDTLGIDEPETKCKLR
ncbi:MAG: ABC transporter substrate-binding protein [Rhodomicrobium sp.]|nr:ABC transporter substrate-binding protein [Rhodomicrobium sp.]